MVPGTCNDDSGCNVSVSFEMEEARVAVFLDPGTYDVAVGGSTATSAGRFTLHMQHIPVSIGTNFIAAPLGTSGTTASSTLPAMSLGPSGSCAPGPSGEDVRWFMHCGASTSMMSLFSLCSADGATFTRATTGATHNPGLFVWSGMAGGIQICNDDAPTTVACAGTGGDTMNVGSRVSLRLNRGISAVHVDDRGAPSGMRYTMRHQIVP